MSVTQPVEPAHEWTQAFTKICDAHRGRLVRYLTAIFGPRDAEDIAQEALTRLYVRPGLVDDTDDAWPWLAVVARNVGRDIARHNSLATTVDAHHLAELPGEVHVWDEVTARDDADRLVRALGRLSGHHRRLIRLRDVQGLGIPEIAELTGTNENTVRQQLFRARRKLQSAYVALGGDRRVGVVGLLSLRVREFVRRHAPVVDVLTASTATVLFAAALPGLAASAAGALGLHHDTPAGYAAAPPAIAGREVPHGAAAIGWHLPDPARGSAAAASARRGTELLHRRQRVGGGWVEVQHQVYGPPASGGGKTDEGSMVIHDPVFGSNTEIKWWGYSSEGPHTVCVYTGQLCPPPKP